MGLLLRRDRNELNPDIRPARVRRFRSRRGERISRRGGAAAQSGPTAGLCVLCDGRHQMAAAVVPLPQTNLPARVTMNEPNQSIGRLLSRSAVELALVTALVFATGWGGVRLAEAVHRHPVTPGRDGTIELPIVKSDRSGNVSFEEGSGYKGWWHCQGGDWGVNWRLVAEFRHYRVLARVARSEAKTEGRIAVLIGDQTLEAAVPETSGPAKWKAVDLGDRQS